MSQLGQKRKWRPRISTFRFTPRKRTQLGHRAMSEKCQVRKSNPILRAPGCPVAYAGYGSDVCKYESLSRAARDQGETPCA
jgi:hypothetical protein